MSVCAQCGSQAADGLCIHHLAPDSPVAATVARHWCNFIHRGVPLPEMPTEHIGMTRQEFLDIFEAEGGDPVTARIVWRTILDEDDGPLTLSRATEMGQCGRYIHKYQGDFGGYA